MQQVIPCGIHPVNVDVMYLTPMGTVFSSTTESEVQTPCPLTGGATRLFVRAETAPGVGNSITLTLRVNGANTGLTVTISGASTSGNDVTHTATLHTGDLIDFLITRSGTPTCNISWAWLFSGAANICLARVLDFFLGSYTVYGGPMGGNQWPGSAASHIWAPCPTAGTISKLYAHLSVAPGASNSRTVTLGLNDGSTHEEVTVTIANNATSGSDTTNTHTVAAGNTLYIKHTAVGTPAAAQINAGWVFTPTVDGESIYLHGAGGNYWGANRCYVAVGDKDTAEGDEADAHQLSLGMTLKKLYAWLNAAPGVGKSWTCTIRVNDANSDLAVTVSGSDTTGSTAGPATTNPTDGARVNLKLVPSGTPAATWGGFGFVGIYAGGTPPVAATPGDLWVEGTELHGGDGQGWERFVEGALTGRTGTVYEISIKNGGTVLLYNGHDGNERQVTGVDLTTNGIAGALVYVIAGTTHQFTDASQDEREFEGALV